MKSKILFLYTELAGYTLACLRELGARGHSVTVLHWPVNPEAPFQLDDIPNVRFQTRDPQAGPAPVAQFIAQTAPDLVICSGWMDKGYVTALRSYKKRSPVVLVMDNQWKGSLKQRLMTGVGSLYLRRLFTHAWVAGASQREYALRMGFDPSAVAMGFYSADTELFESVYQAGQAKDRSRFPKRFLYVGRYIHRKGIAELWDAFIAAKQGDTQGWELICIGTGELFDERKEHPGIAHLGFKQPQELRDILAEGGICVLPSHFEPWGVVVHEMAQAGLPLLLSDTIGAAEEFLVEGDNGFSFRAMDAGSLEQKMRQCMQLSDAQLWQMADRSHAQALSNSPSIWADRLLSFL